MRLYCKGDIVIATHPDDQSVDPAIYGADVSAITIPDDFVLVERIGAEPAPGQPDERPYRKPKLQGLDRMVAVKAECRRRIYAVASAEAQMNVSTAGIVYAAKAAADRSAEEGMVIAGAAAGIGWVAAMKAAIPALVANPNTDYTADESWPQCPPEAAAVYGQF